MASTAYRTLAFSLSLFAAHAVAQAALGGSGAMGGSAALAAGPPVVTTTNIAYVDSASNQVNTGTTASITYACASTSNREIILARTNQSSLALSDTGGEASGATVLGSGTFGTDVWKSWNMACAAGSNTITITAGGSGATEFELGEYSGIGSGSDGVASQHNGTAGTSCTVSPTAADTGDLAVTYQSTNNIALPAALSSLGFTTRMYTNVGGTVTYGTAYVQLIDDLYAPLGTVTWTGTFTSTTNDCFTVLIPGTAAATPSYYPTLVQAYSSGASSPGTWAFPKNVTSGHVLAVAVGYEATTPPVSAPTDTLGTTYTLQVHDGVSGQNGVFLYTGVAPSSGADTVSATANGDTDIQGSIAEFTELTGTVTNTASSHAATSPLTWSQTVANNNSVVVACASTLANLTYSGFANGYTLTAATGGVDRGLVCQWVRVLSSGTSSPSVTLSNAAYASGASVVIQ